MKNLKSLLNSAVEAKLTSVPTPIVIIKPTISAAIGKLSKFSDKEEIPSILMTLSSFEISGDIEDGAIEGLWGKLRAIQSSPANTTIVRDHSSFSEAAYYALLALAELKPYNDVCFVTLSEIDEENRVVVSSGEHFDIEQLVHYHNTRDYRGSVLGESYDSKYLLSPYTHFKFPARDVQQLKAFAVTKVTKELVFKHLKEETASQTSSAQPTTFSILSILSILESPPSMEQKYEEHHPETKEREIKLPEFKRGRGNPYRFCNRRHKALEQLEASFLDFLDIKSPLPPSIADEKHLSQPDVKQLGITSISNYTITPEQAEKLGKIKTRVVLERGLEALSEGLITIEQIITMDIYNVFFLLDSDGHVLAALRAGTISMAQINNLNPNKAEYLANVPLLVVSALRDNLITIDQINAMDDLKMLKLFSYTGNGIAALKEGLITIDQINAMPWLKLEKIFEINCLNALREGRTSIPQIMEMEYGELSDRVRDNNFPSTHLATP